MISSAEPGWRYTAYTDTDDETVDINYSSTTAIYLLDKLKSLLTTFLFVLESSNKKKPSTWREEAKISTNPKTVTRT